MKFHYEFDIQKPNYTIEHRHKLFLMGSCFTENIGEKLRSNKFSVLENPHGILFNPISVSQAVNAYIEKKAYQKNELFNFNDLWHSWEHHSRFSAVSPEEALIKINGAVDAANAFLKQADFLFITLGSAWVYALCEGAPGYKEKKVVANNHKAPTQWFKRSLLSVEEVLASLNNVLHRIFIFNPSINIIFTISPVRHLREGVIDNNRSKAVLIQSVHHLVQKFERLYYFPAYELIIDDLRDYRFYAEDLVHPNYFASQYVWEKIVASFMKEETRKLMDEMTVINRALQHKPFHASSEQHKKFTQSFLERVSLLQKQYPNIDFSRELAFFSSPVT